VRPGARELQSFSLRRLQAALSTKHRPVAFRAFWKLRDAISEPMAADCGGADAGLRTYQPGSEAAFFKAACKSYHRSLIAF
jgi:hypothetical protein